MDRVKQLSAQVALHEMMSGPYFSICVIDSVGKLLDRRVHCEAYNVLHTLHCIHFSKMPPELLEQIPGLIKECLSRDGVEFEFNSKLKSFYSHPPIDLTPKRPILERLGFK
jgi:hypothetical protein